MANEMIFDGVDDFVSITPISPLRTDKGFSVGCWVNLNNLSGIQGIFEQNNLTGSIYTNLQSSGGIIRWQGYGPYPSGGNVYNSSVIGSSIWQYITATYEPPSGGVLYINSNQVATGNVICYDVNSSEIKIGSIMNGAIKDFRIYEKILSADDVKLLYNYGSGLDVNNSGQLLIKGILEDEDFSAKEQRSDITLRGRNYGARLQDITIPPEVYTNEEISAIIIDFMTKYCPDITVNHVNNTGLTLPRQAYSHTSIFQALQDLSDYAAYTFYVDEEKDLHFEPRQTTDSGQLLNNENTLNTQWKNTRKEMANNVWVYGDSSTSQWKELLAVGSPGSVYTLQYKPSSTRVEILGSVFKGGIYDMALESGAQYLVNYDDKQIVFVSGTGYGNHIPTAGSILIYYDRTLPIIKYSVDRVSEGYYGEKDKVIIDRNIKDPNQAEELMKSELDRLSNPKTEGTITLKSDVDFVPGQTVLCDFPNEGIGNKNYDILQVDYKLDKKSLLADNYLQLKLNQRIKTLSDEIVSIRKSIEKLQAGEIVSTDLLTRYEVFTSDVTPQAHYEISARSIGTSFVMGNLALAKVGFGTLGSSGLASWVMIASGGDY